MVAVDVPVLKSMTFGELGEGFFTYGGAKKVYFSYWHGRMHVNFPVLADGRIDPGGIIKDVPLPFPGESIQVIHPKDLGITKIEWAEGPELVAANCG